MPVTDIAFGPPNLIACALGDGVLKLVDTRQQPRRNLYENPIATNDKCQFSRISWMQQTFSTSDYIAMCDLDNDEVALCDPRMMSQSGIPKVIKYIGAVAATASPSALVEKVPYTLCDAVWNPHTQGNNLQLLVGLQQWNLEDQGVVWAYSLREGWSDNSAGESECTLFENIEWYWPTPNVTAINCSQACVRKNTHVAVVATAELATNMTLKLDVSPPSKNTTSKYGRPHASGVHPQTQLRGHTQTHTQAHTHPQMVLNSFSNLRTSRNTLSRMHTSMYYDNPSTHRSYRSSCANTNTEEDQMTDDYTPHAVPRTFPSFQNNFQNESIPVDYKNVNYNYDNNYHDDNSVNCTAEILDGIYGSVPFRQNEAEYSNFNVELCDIPVTPVAQSRIHLARLPN